MLLEDGFRADGHAHGLDLLFSDLKLLCVDEMVQLFLQLAAIVAVIRVPLRLEPLLLGLLHKSKVALLAHELIVPSTVWMGDQIV